MNFNNGDKKKNNLNKQPRTNYNKKKVMKPTKPPINNNNKNLKQNNGKQQFKTNYNNKKVMKPTKPIKNDTNLKKPIKNNKTQPLSQSGIKEEMQKNTNKKTLQPSQSESQISISPEEERTIDRAIKTVYYSKQKQRKPQFYKSQNSFYPKLDCCFPKSEYCLGKHYHLSKLDQKHEKGIIPEIKRMNERLKKYQEEDEKLEVYKRLYGDRKGEEFYYNEKLNKQNFIGQDNKKQKLSQHGTYQNLDNLKSPVNSY